MKEFSFLLSNSLLFPIFWVFLQITFVNITLSMLHQSLVFHVCRFYNNYPKHKPPQLPHHFDFFSIFRFLETSNEAAGFLLKAGIPLKKTALGCR